MHYLIITKTNGSGQEFSDMFDKALTLFSEEDISYKFLNINPHTLLVLDGKQLDDWFEENHPQKTALFRTIKSLLSKQDLTNEISSLIAQFEKIISTIYSEVFDTHAEPVINFKKDIILILVHWGAVNPGTESDSLNKLLEQALRALMGQEHIFVSSFSTVNAEIYSKIVEPSGEAVFSFLSRHYVIPTKHKGLQEKKFSSPILLKTLLYEFRESCLIQAYPKLITTEKLDSNQDYSATLDDKNMVIKWQEIQEKLNLLKKDKINREIEIKITKLKETIEANPKKLTIHYIKQFRDTTTALLNLLPGNIYS